MAICAFKSNLLLWKLLHGLISRICDKFTQTHVQPRLVMKVISSRIICRP